MNIPIGNKLNSSNLSQIIENYWDLSLKSNSVIFDFSNTEWISNSEFVFIINWINNLTNMSIVVGIQLPKDNGIGILERKKRFQHKILFDWEIQKYFGNKIKVYKGDISNVENRKYSNNEIIKIPIIDYSPENFDKSFAELFNLLNLNSFSILTKELTSLNHLESELLNFAITKELYSNTVIHSGLKENSECIYSFSINKKISDNKANRKNLEEREKELSNLEKSFFLDEGKYRNIDFVEINFQDFGYGIVKTLKEKYYNDKDHLMNYFEDEYELHESTNEDSQILHYALLLFTSKYEVDKRFEVHDFIPRGLYILQELVAKYQGYLEIFSGSGAIGISYFQGKKTIQFAKKNNVNRIFPGTRIRIVFPSKESILKLRPSKIPHISEKYENKIILINLIELLCKTKFDFIPDISLNNIEKKITLLSLFFDSFSKYIATIKKNSIVVLDFSGLNSRTEDILLKLLFFITHSPINTNYRIIIVNILAKQLNSIVNESKKTREYKGLFIYPIPVIYPNLITDWIGIEDENLKYELNNIWRKGDGYSKYIVLDNIEKYICNSIKIEPFQKGYNVSVTLPDFRNVIIEITVALEKLYQDEIRYSKINYRYLEDKNHNYNCILRRKEGYVYLTSHGILQNEYISFNDKLYRSEYTRLLVTHLIFLNYATTDAQQDLSKISKILSVTLSSQFLACEINSVLKELFPNCNSEIVALSNYYEFYKEKGFNDIRHGDKVLVINDIISTGKLTETIFDTLEKKGAIPTICLVLVDTRSQEKNNSRFQYPIISLANFSLTKFEKLPVDKKILWVNPILNAPVTLRKEKHEINSLISPKDFLEYIEEEDIILGCIKNNAYYLTYYLKTDNIIKRELLKKNDSLFYTLFHLLKDKKKKNNSNELSLIIKGLNILNKNIDSESKKKTINKITKQLYALCLDEIFSEYNVDLICYPFLSNIQVIEKDFNIFKESGLSNNNPNIFPIPRVLTEKGWRFTFPPKFLNILSEKLNPSVLILDDGSSTGNTIMQMIDSIAFLNVKSIDVLSIFGRLEDFQKELFSRLKSIRTKNNVVPLNVFFGVHMNLPVLTESENPFFVEAKEINALIEILGSNVDENFCEFLKNRSLILLESSNSKSQLYQSPSWNEVSKKQMLIIRHSIAKYDSYRLYSEDIAVEGIYEFWGEDNISKLTLLSVLNLEPNLYKVLKRLIPPSNIQNIIEFCFSILKSNPNKIQLEFITKSLFYLDPVSFIKSDRLLNLIELYKKNNADVELYHNFNLQILLIAFEIRYIEDVIAKKGALSNFFEFINKIKFTDEDLFDRQFRFLNNQLVKLNEGIILKDKEIKISDKPINIYRKLQNYFMYVLPFERRHQEKKLEWQIDGFNLKINDLIYAMNDFNFNQELDDFKKIREEFSNCYYYKYEEYNYIKSILAVLNDYKPKNLDFNPCALYSLIQQFEDLLNNNKSIELQYLYKLKEIINLYKTSILFSNSSFNKFIRLSESNIGKIWFDCENRYKSNEMYRPISIKTDLNFDVTVNSYVMFLTIDNLITNKIQYARDYDWELEVSEIENNRIVLRITQFSDFKFGGTGNGQSEIRRFLIQNGVFYKRESISPYYIIRIDLPKN